MTPNPPELEQVPWVVFDRRRPVASLFVATAKTWYGAREQGADRYRCDFGRVWALALRPGDKPAEVVRAEVARRAKGRKVAA
jgi:hypothetical protein